MGNILLFLALFTLTSTAIQLSLFRRWWQQLVPLGLIALILMAFWPRAIQLGAGDIQAWLTDPGAMLDLSVILVLEAFLMALIAIAMVRDIYQPLRPVMRAVLMLQYLPALTCAGILAYYLVHVYQQALPYEFRTIAMGYTTGAIAALALAGYLIRFLIPARVLRLELKLAMHAAQIALAVATSVLTARYPYRSSEIEPNLVEFGAVLVIVFVGAAAGLWWYRRSVLRMQTLQR